MNKLLPCILLVIYFASTGMAQSWARCVVNHHTPICSCPPSYTGNPHIRCDRIPDCAPTTEQPSNNLNITNEFNDGIALILAKFRPSAERPLVERGGGNERKFKMQSNNGILYNFTANIIHWPAGTIKLSSNNEDNSMFLQQTIFATFEAYLQTSNQRIETEIIAIYYVVKLTPKNEISIEVLNIDQNQIKLLANSTQYKPNEETVIKKEIETHIKTTLEEYLIANRRETIEVKERIFDLFDRFSHNNLERYYFIDAIPSTNYTLNNVTIYGLWITKSVAYNGNSLSNLPKIEMSSVRGSLVQNFPSGTEKLSFEADNIYILADHIPKAKVVVRGYSVVNVRLNTALADDQSVLIIESIESAIAASIQSAWDTIKKKRSERLKTTFEQKPQEISPCIPSPCGPCSQCKEYNEQAICSCLPSFVGTPPQCRPQCVTNSECAQNKECINQRCQDPCTEACGTSARCVVNNHTPICSCPPSYTGNPHIRCDRIPEPVEIRPCDPSPCGPNSQCTEYNNQTVCTCIPGYVGIPPMCKAECVANSECNLNEVCINRKCTHECSGACVIEATCGVINSRVWCSCKPGYTGNPFSHCQVIVESAPHQPRYPCSSLLCGPNAICTVKGEIPSCSCLPEYLGSPPNCRPQCKHNIDDPTVQCDPLNTNQN